MLATSVCARGDCSRRMNCGTVGALLCNECDLTKLAKGTAALQFLNASEAEMLQSGALGYPRILRLVNQRLCSPLSWANSRGFFFACCECCKE
ncbi:GPI-anchored surface protein, putative [Bodo saltans]|uniref:GPI-anchored surface protein, putative n=1 Tax=Bodo saltans TaxID=75058 RepID=A0A0S4J0P4_BODSA|nr:GPI-anchored surface protein, putative [Bodo saltans]|eukprot:CUG40682.1 GPI-anchored surface protein, putative [Bodo saltans]